MTVGLDDESMSSLPLRIIHRLATLATVAIALTWVWVTTEEWQVDNSITPCIVMSLMSSFACESYDDNEVRQH